MVRANVPHGGKAEALLAELAAAACRVALQQGCKGAFIDLELDLWYVLQARLGQPNDQTPRPREQ
jgi:hypothetical protein